MTPVIEFWKVEHQVLKMNNWMPLFAGFAGALIGGAISILGQWLSARYQAKSQKLAWAEERSRWAAERRLDDFRAMFDHIEQLYKAVIQFRIRQAHERAADKFRREVPSHVTSENEARSGFENAIAETHRSILLLDEPFMEWSEKFSNLHFDWLMSMSTDEGIDILLSFEDSIREFRQFVASEYKKAMMDRAGASL